MLHYLATILPSLRVTVRVRSTSSFLKPGRPLTPLVGRRGLKVPLLIPYFLGKNKINSMISSSKVFGVAGKVVILLDLTKSDTNYCCV